MPLSTVASLKTLFKFSRLTYSSRRMGYHGSRALRRRQATDNPLFMSRASKARTGVLRHQMSKIESYLGM